MGNKYIHYIKGDNRLFRRNMIDNELFVFIPIFKSWWRTFDNGVLNLKKVSRKKSREIIKSKLITIRRVT